ncbi:PrgI family protein [Streptomyces melanosporofaciens]|uniref:PrgI family protein n=1 Tax=Streptomyces melanosporofaciens TaxID=67327 RepID=A0A1H4KMY5_STRMJ|nr:PrgI family protein [Streptomyces melanosporofaciens]SEB59837.1 PrgI family protein [Streptomyces melanosporofaciens]
MTQPVRIPADVDREDTVLGSLTARQLLILTVAGIVLYGTWAATRDVVPLAVFAVLAIPIAVATVLLALGRRDGISLDRLALAALRQRMSPRYRVAAPEGILPAPAWLASRVTRNSQDLSAKRDIAPVELELPAEGVTETGVVDLGPDGVAAVAVCSTVNFSLRTPAEQESLTAAFGRYLHSLTAPVQVLVRTERLDLTGQISELREQAPRLPHPALEEAAREHADYLGQLGAQSDLLHRQVLLILRESLGAQRAVDGLGGASPLAAFTRRRRSQDSAQPSVEAARRAAEARLVRRLNEAVDLLSPAGIVVTPLDAGQATAVLAAACNPDSLVPVSSHLAGADDVITTAPVPEDDACLSAFERPGTSVSGTVHTDDDSPGGTGAR